MQGNLPTLPNLSNLPDLQKHEGPRPGMRGLRALHRPNSAGYGVSVAVMPDPDMVPAIPVKANELATQVVAW